MLSRPSPKRCYSVQPLVLLLLLAALLLVPTTARAQDEQPLPDDRPLYIPGRLVVGVSPNAAGAVHTAGAEAASASVAATLQVASALQGMDAQVIQAADPCVASDLVSDLSGARAPDQSAGATTVQSWQVAPDQEDAALALLRQQPGIVFAERDVYVYAAQEAGQDATAGGDGDASAAEQVTEAAYQLNDPLYAPHQWAPQRANFPRAWQLVPDIGALTTIRVAVIDTGVDFSHPDLGLRLLPGKNYIDPNQLPQDDSGHGTHLAGIIAGIANNGLGIAGSAPKVLIDPRKVLGGKDGIGTASNVRYAICDAARAGDQVINMSFEVPAKNSSPDSELYTILKEAVVFAEARGVLMVAAGGNHGLVAYPAMFDEVMAVSALTVNNSLASYSARGSKIEIAAPGGDSTRRILSTWPANEAIRSYCSSALLVESGSAWYCASAGTSMAAPYVAGAAALAWSINPNLTATQLRALLGETATDVGLPSTEQGAGLLNAEALVRRLLPSSLIATPDGAGKSVAPGSAPYTTTIVLSNPSLDPLAVTAVTSDAGAWLKVTNSGSLTMSGSIRYGQPLIWSAVVSPTHLAAGTYTAKVQVTATRTDGTMIAKTLSLFVAVGVQRPPLYLPIVSQSATPQQQAIVGSGFTWEAPISPTVYNLGAAGSTVVALPPSFVFPFAGPAGADPLTYGSARIYADGFITFPGSDYPAVDDPGTNRCLPLVDFGQVQGIFGWWADLDASVPGAEISTFRPAGEPSRFVIQYKNLASAGVTPAYRVSFQIVLYADGDVQLNYLQVPPAWATSLTDLRPLATVGVQAQNGLFRNEVACQTASQYHGALPQSSQSMRIKNSDLY